MKFCLAIDLAIGGNWDVIWPPMFATRYDSLLLLFIPGSKYLQPTKKIIFYTDHILVSQNITTLVSESALFSIS